MVRSYPYVCTNKRVDCDERFFTHRMNNLPARYGSLWFDFTPFEAGSPAASG
jgi:hypothetical protein